MKKTFFAVLSATVLAAMAAVAPAQTATGVIVPQFAQNGTSNRLPVATLVTISGLTPSSTYRYITQAVNPTEAAEGPATTNGAGNPLFSGTSAFVYTSSPDFAANYGEFTTDGTGSYTGWFAIVPTGNARFADGSVFHVRIRTNDGLGGTTITNRVTLADGITTKVFGATSTNTTGITSTSSPLAERNFVVLYDNVAGTGRPLYAGAVGSIGTTVATTVAFYDATAQSTATAWAAAIPNDLANGVRRIEERSATGALVATWTDADGVWAGGANTVNPAGGSTPLTIVNPADYASSVEDWMVL